jgi:hypothetical protein
MASSISAGTTSSTALVATADTTGALVLQTNNGTTALTLDTSQNATFAGTATVNTVGSASATALTLKSAGTNALILDTSQKLQFNSGYGSVATAYGCRAWVNFNGTGTVAINANGNVSSITDNGVGDYTVNFTTSMPDANFSVSGMAKSSDTDGTRFAAMQLIANATAISTSFVRVTVQYENTTTRDANPVSVAIFR